MVPSRLRSLCCFYSWQSRAITSRKAGMKFLVVDDHTLIREALALIQEHPDLSLMRLDLKLPDRDGFDVMAELREHHPALSVVMLSAFNDRDNVIKALDGGALGFIPKTGSRDVLVSALRLILAGGVYIPPDILNREPAATAE